VVVVFKRQRIDRGVYAQRLGDRDALARSTDTLNLDVFGVNLIHRKVFLNLFKVLVVVVIELTAVLRLLLVVGGLFIGYAQSETFLIFAALLIEELVRSVQLVLN